jgi:hypothetical protein
MKTSIRIFPALPAILLVSAVALLSASSATSAAQGTNVTGEWAFTVTTDQGSGNPTITFKQDGEKLTGKYNGTFGAADLTGTVKGNAIMFTFNIDAQGQQATATYQGTVEKTTMKGTMDIAGMLTGTFTATKK